MTIIKQLSGEASAGDWREPRGILASVHAEVAKGCFLHVTLGAAGLVVRHGEATVGIPIAELVALAQTHEPAFRPPTQ